MTPEHLANVERLIQVMRAKRVYDQWRRANVKRAKEGAKP